MDIDDLWYKRDGSPSARHGKGSRWQARWRTPDGKQRGKTFARKIDAERYLATTTADKARGRYVDPAAGKALLRNFAADWKSGLSSGPSNLVKIDSHLRNHILPGLGDRQLSEIRPSVVSSWQAGLLKRLSLGYVRGLRSTLSALLDAAVEDQLISSNPCRSRSARLGRPPVRKVVPWTAGQLGAVAASIDDRLTALVETGAGEGLRQGELLGLEWGDVDFLRRVLHVRRQVLMLDGQAVYSLPKGGKTRDVPLADPVGLALARHIKQHPPARVELPWEQPGGKPRAHRLLFHEDGSAWTRTRFAERAWHPALKAAGIERSAGSGDGCHMLRHYAASVWLAGGCSIRDVAEWLGHNDPGFTLRTYTHLMPSAPDRMREAVAQAFKAASDDNVQHGTG